MKLLFGVAPLMAGAYLAYSLAILRQVSLPIYSAPNRKTFSRVSYGLLALFSVLLLFFALTRNTSEAFLVLALCITALIAILQFRVIIGENGVFMKLRFFPWSDFNGFRWKKFVDKGYWTLYLYQVDSVEILSVDVPEPLVSRLDLLLHNRIGLRYQKRS